MCAEQLQEIYRLNLQITQRDKDNKQFLNDIILLLKKNFISKQEIAEKIEKHLTS